MIFLEMWLRPQNLTQRHSKSSFFLTNKTGTLYGDEVGWIKPILRFFLMNFLFRCQKRVYRANQRLSTFFQIDFEVIRMIRSKDFSFSFAENISKFVIFRENIGKVKSFCKFCRISLNV